MVPSVEADDPTARIVATLERGVNNTRRPEPWQRCAEQLRPGDVFVALGRAIGLGDVRLERAAETFADQARCQTTAST